MSFEELKHSLLRPECWNSDRPVELIETHLSCLFLVGDRAYKLKKPVDFGFVDFTTLEQRKFYCEEELRLNQRTAAELYRGVRTITGTVDSPRLDGDGPVLDYVVEMERFSQDDLLSRWERDGRLTFEHMDQLAESIASFHEKCPIASADSPFGASDRIIHTMNQNFEFLSDDRLPSEVHSRIQNLKMWAMLRHLELEEWFSDRKTAGRIRECHGDMHLDNLIMRHGKITAFDGIEFNEDFRWIDTISEIAFCAMDLAHRGHPELSHHFVNRYLEITGDYSSLKGLPYYLCERAMVRAKVTWLRILQNPGDAEQKQLHEELNRFVALAERYAFERPNGLILMCGVSGSGKSFGAEKIVHELGAIRIRSDVERKRIAAETGLDPEDLYSSEMTKDTYARLHQLAVMSIRQGALVVLDATYNNIFWRTLELGSAKGCQVPFRILFMTASEEVLQDRIRRRQQAGTDPSDADLLVLAEQLRARDPISEAEREFTIDVDTEQPDCWERAIE
ncbi:MAG TPA: AAA family ATPase, partial [Planctomycetaceae bacterium]|nr:AAA family ATPase [Planctomycetaceae bacterium]